MMKIREESAGFTIIEMLVSIALLLMLSGVLFQVFTNAREVSRKSESWIEIQQNARCLFDFMERDLSGVVLAGRNAGVAGEADPKYFQVQDTDVTDVTYYGYQDGAGTKHERDSFRLLTRSLNPGFANIVEVGYWLDVGPDDPNTNDVRRNNLRRYYDYVSDDTNDDGDDLTIYDEDDTSGTYGRLIDGVTVWTPTTGMKSNDVIARGVTDLTMEYLDGCDWRPLGTDNWKASFVNLPSSSGLGLGQLPIEVRITVYITDSKGIFLSGNTDAKPYCGSGMKFVHIVLVSER